MRQVIYHGKLPDPFLCEDGSRITPEQWPSFRQALREKIVTMEYGGMPPRPEYLRIEPLNGLRRGHTGNWFKIHVGTKEKQLAFNLELFLPECFHRGPLAPEEKYPVILTGDGCYCNMESPEINEILSRGFIAARFNRLDFANDAYGSRDGGLYNIYPGNYSDISAWAWGYSVCMDVFEQLPYTDETEVAITGHSRGGKTVMLAAVVDERIKYVCPNNSGCHGAVSHRVEVPVQEGVPRRTETLADMCRNVPSWMGPALFDYQDCVEKLPYDMHYFGALIAPRYYLQCEGMQDYWINPMGAWQNFMAVKECYRYLGCPDHAGAWFRSGGHRHRLPDYTEFLDFITRAQSGAPLAEHLQINPYPDMERNFDW